LTDTVRTVRPAGARTPIVLAGGLLTGDNVLAGEVRARLLELWPDAAISTAGDGAAAAAWLAARTLPGADPAALHARLVG
jgi:glucosamine kinase